ncbi:MAG: acyl-CoA thioesterase [Myxococcales bacterium]|nr:acyl-CoA thioesterase [Myxococcales bacterium]
MAFETSLSVRFGDEDHAGIVYYPRFLDFFHRAFEDFFNEQGYPYRFVLDEDRTGWPAVNVQVDFHSPLRFGDLFEIGVQVARLGTKSATFLYRGRVADRAVATGRITVACVDMQTFEPKPIPPHYRLLFERHLQLEAPEGAPPERPRRVAR